MYITSVTYTPYISRRTVRVVIRDLVRVCEDPNVCALVRITLTQTTCMHIHTFLSIHTHIELPHAKTTCT